MHLIHFAFTIKILCSIRTPHPKCQRILSKSLFGGGTLCLSREKKKCLALDRSIKLSYIYLMTKFRLNTDWSQPLWQKIALCFLALWDAIVTDKIEKPVNDNSGLSPTVVSKCSVSGFFFFRALFMNLFNSYSCPLVLDMHEYST